jgi:hypothetical protein
MFEEFLQAGKSLFPIVLGVSDPKRLLPSVRPLNALSNTQIPRLSRHICATVHVWRTYGPTCEYVDKKINMISFRTLYFSFVRSDIRRTVFSDTWYCGDDIPCIDVIKRARFHLDRYSREKYNSGGRSNFACSQAKAKSSLTLQFSTAHACD